ncbi:MAG: pantoate--beta-alanine ligase [Bacteroidia bacterium]
MKIFTKTDALIQFRNGQQGVTIGFVPTMGALHQGHLELIKKSLSENDFTYVSIFVNPLQFNDKKDFENYPITTEQDIEALKQIGVNALFLPNYDEVYKVGITADEIDLSYLNTILEGPKRPGHFEGVVKVVSILFKIIRPHRAYFGLKDFQQVKVIQELVRQKKYPIQIIEHPTIREFDGLAMSSRNRRLSEQGRQRAKRIYQWLLKAREMYKNGQGIYTITDVIKKEIAEDKNFTLDYFEIRDADTLREITNAEQRAVALIAVYLEGVRLIDNMEL